jgi:hypothetical protein
VESSPLGERFTAHDLILPFPDLGTFDLAISFEVAEHLPANRAAGFIADLCSLAPVVAFSAAIPGQGGTGHINEQWPAYWCDLFAGCGYQVTGALRWEIWNDDNIENWYRQNLIVAVKGEPPTNELAELLTSPLAPVWPVVHPILFNHVRGA